MSDGLPINADVGEYEATGRGTCNKTAQRYKISHWGFVNKDENTPATYAQIKAAIFQFGSCVLTVDAGGFNDYSGGVMTYQGRGTDHQITVDGWDDGKTGNGYSGALRIRNQWGPSWGETINGQPGYGWLAAFPDGTIAASGSSEVAWCQVGDGPVPPTPPTPPVPPAPPVPPGPLPPVPPTPIPPKPPAPINPTAPLSQIVPINLTGSAWVIDGSSSINATKWVFAFDPAPKFYAAFADPSKVEIVPADGATFQGVALICTSADGQESVAMVVIPLASKSETMKSVPMVSIPIAPPAAPAINSAEKILSGSKTPDKNGAVRGYHLEKRCDPVTKTCRDWWIPN
jgi:hypothetical protein